MVLLACVVPASVVAVILFVVWGPVPARRSLFAPRSGVGPGQPLAMPIAAAIPPPPLSFVELDPIFTAPPPSPVAVATPAVAPRDPTPTPLPRHARALPIELPRERSLPAMNPGLAPVVRTPRGDALPPLRRAARGTDAPPILVPPVRPHDHDPDTAETTDEVPIVELSDFDVEELTRIDHA
jgi:hypothetical protein